ncbi:uncharacterized protein [Drosophila takahashii]|uniref:uncharacterized protein n=1 Tax=Drosophila takahashii TaxID=29030 RepID=UPI0007E7546D|nr:uncharacterized protein LOC108067223 [Drosophila takahashii]
MANSGRRDMRVPSPKMMLPQLQALEEEADESALDFHETVNQAWRAQFMHPAMARLGIGFEFVRSPCRYINLSQSTQEDEAENREFGNSTSSGTRLVRLLNAPQIEIHPYSFGSDDENQMQQLP